MTLVEFLLARIAEDEVRARASAAVDGAAEMLAALPAPLFDGLRVAFPARVLAECEAKRQIVALHSRDHECSVFEASGEIDNCAWTPHWEACSTLRLLALPYADHPDYDEAWRP